MPDGEMSEPRANPVRSDPYRNFKFHISWVGRTVAGFNEVSPPLGGVVLHRAGGDPGSSQKSPGRTEYEPITLERGVTQDTEFQDWASQVSTLGTQKGSKIPPANFRKDILLESYDEAGQLVTAYTVFRCWVSEYHALPDLDANSNAVTIEHIRLENEGWRDTSVKEPKRSGFK